MKYLDLIVRLVNFVLSYLEERHQRYLSDVETKSKETQEAKINEESKLIRANPRDFFDDGMLGIPDEFKNKPDKPDSTGKSG